MSLTKRLIENCKRLVGLGKAPQGRSRAANEIRRTVAAVVHVKQMGETEQTLEKALIPFFQKQAKSAAAKLPRATGDDAASVARQIFNPGDWDDELVDITLPLLADAMAEGAKSVLIEGDEAVQEKGLKFNTCHDPATGRFCSGSGGGAVGVAGSPVAGSTTLGGGINTTHVVELEDGTNGVFKPTSGEDPLDKEWAAKHREMFPPGTQASREVAASIVDEEMGLGLVPKTVMRDEAGLGGSGSMQEFVPDAHEGLVVGIEPLSMAQRSDVVHYDLLVGNVDRHSKNWMVTNDDQVKLIDNGFSFSTNAKYAASDSLPFRTFEFTADRTTVWHQQTPKFKEGLNRIRNNRASVDAKLKMAGLSSAERRSFWARADAIAGEDFGLTGDSGALGRLAYGLE